MAIEISNNYALYQVTDTLHQLVDRLNYNQQLFDSNTRLLDSSVNDLMGVYDSVSITPVADFTINADTLTLDVDSSLVIASDDTISITAENTIFIRSDNSSVLVGTGGPVPALLLRDENTGSPFGGLKKGSTATEIELLSGLSTAATFTSDDMTVAGTITMPSSGEGSPATVAKTVHAAITEVHNEVDTLRDDLTPRINTLEGKVSTIEGQITSLQNADTLLDGRINNLEALNISNRLNTIEANIQNILLRLDILEI